jgi:hypothetical protein
LACTEYKRNLYARVTVIRGQQYVTVIAVGEDVKLVEKETWP